MIRFWIRTSHRNWLQLTAGLVVTSFLFVTVSTPFAHAKWFDATHREHVLTQTLEDYSQHLKEIKGEDFSSKKEISNLINALKNRLSLLGPVKREGKSYLLGAYQGEKARVNFILEVEQDPHPHPSPLPEGEGTNSDSTFN